MTTTTNRTDTHTERSQTMTHDTATTATDDLRPLVHLFRHRYPNEVATTQFSGIEYGLDDDGRFVWASRSIDGTDYDERDFLTALTGLANNALGIQSYVEANVFIAARLAALEPAPSGEVVVTDDQSARYDRRVLDALRGNDDDALAELFSILAEVLTKATGVPTSVGLSSAWDDEDDEDDEHPLIPVYASPDDQPFISADGSEVWLEQGVCDAARASLTDTASFLLDQMNGA